jgi:hypothetical protein
VAKAGRRTDGLINLVVGKRVGAADNIREPGRFKLLDSRREVKD